MSTRASAWPRSANISGNKQKTSLFRSEKGKAPGRALFLFAPGAQNFFAAKRPGLFFAPRGRRRFFPKGKCSQPPILFSAAQPPRPFLAAPQVRRPTQGACGSGDRSLFNQKGPPLRRAQWGTKRTGRWSGPRENAPGGQSRHFCGNAVRHRIAGRARFDGGTMFPRKPLLFGRGILAG